MTLETDLLVDRRRLKRRLALWRLIGIAAVVAAILAVLPHRFGATGLHAQHITRVRVEGLITYDPKLVARIEAIAKDHSVHAVILTIDSPGGSVAGGESLHDAIAHVAAVKPVVAVMGSEAASAGYMIAVPAARIFARAGTLTGSIGVLLETGEISGLLGKLGITAEALTSGPLKDQPSFIRPLSPLGREYLQGLVMDLYEQFVAMVAAGRHMDPARVRALGDGRAYTGQQALQLGLIDELGGEAEARDWLAAREHVASTLPIEDLQPSGFLARHFGGNLNGLLKTLVVQGLTLDGVWALWQPSLAGR